MSIPAVPAARITSKAVSPFLAESDVSLSVSLLRQTLLGKSVIDLPRLWFHNRDGVDKFLRLHCFDTDNPLDLDRLREMHRDATLYLTEEHNFILPGPVEQPRSVHDIFLDASSGGSEIRKFACMVLKVMHIQHHLASKELCARAPISDTELQERLNRRVFTALDTMRAQGISVQEFTTGRKSRTSMVTKLLAKRQSLASRVFDKLRFRIVLEDRSHLLQALLHLLNHLVPFNYVLPGQSANGLITLCNIADHFGITEAQVKTLWSGTEESRTEQPLPVSEGVQPLPTPRNEFSGESYRNVSFIADIPLRIDDVMTDSHPAVTFVQAEVQLVDAQGHKANNRGENAHALYKKRKLETVRNRLLRTA